MRRFIGLIALVFVGIIAWRIGESLSSDAISMAVGVLFGVLAGIPTALLVLVGGRRQEAAPSGGGESGGTRNYQQNAPRLPDNQMAYPQQPPVIVVAPSQMPGQMLPQQNGGYGYPAGYPAQQQQGHYQDQYQGQPMLEARPDPGYENGYQNHSSGQRHFKVVGEQEEWVDGF